MSSQRTTSPDKDRPMTRRPPMPAFLKQQHIAEAVDALDPAACLYYIGHDESSHTAIILSRPEDIERHIEDCVRDSGFCYEFGLDWLSAETDPDDFSYIEVHRSTLVVRAYGIPWGIRLPHDLTAADVFEAIQIKKQHHQHQERQAEREEANARRQTHLFTAGGAA